MKSPSWLPRWLLGSSVILGLAPAAAADSKHPDSSAENDTSIIPGIFTTELPNLLRANNIRFTIRPHFGDLVHHDYLGFAFNVRYGLTPQWELSSELETYVAHGLKHEHFLESAGVDRMSLAAKYKFEDFLQPYWDTAAGAGYSFPLGRPPAELTDGYQHITPYFSMAHTFDRHPDITGYISYGFDFVSRVYTAVDSATDSLNHNSWSVTPGFVVHRKAVNYILEASFSSTEGFGNGNDYSVGVHPSLQWTLPPRFKLNSKNRWVIGIGLKASYGSNGSDYGANLRVQTDFDFKRLLPWHHPKPVPNTAP